MLNPNPAREAFLEALFCDIESRPALFAFLVAYVGDPWQVLALKQPAMSWHKLP
jgi:hypothetical protein